MTPAEFKIRYPQFATEIDGRIQLQIDEASLFLSADVWGEFYDKATGLIVAHNLTLENAATASSYTTNNFSGVTSESAGDVSYSAGESLVKAVMENPFNATKYGQDYLYLLKRLGIGAVAV